MVDSVDKTIKYTFVSDVDKALEDAKKYEAQIKALEKQLKELNDIKFGSPFGTIESPELNAEINAVTKSIADAEAELTKLSSSLDATGTSSEKAATGVATLGEASGKAEKGLFDLGNVAQRVFRSIVGFIVLNILRQLLDLYGELTNKGKEFADSILQISVSTRSLQRAGLDVTMEEVGEAIDELAEKFKVFTKQDLNAGVSQLFDIGRQLNLTKDQMYELANAVAYLATKNNREFTPSMNEVLTALVNGQTRGLKGLDLAIDENAIKLEAQRLGLLGVGEELDNVTKAQALYSLIIQEVNKNSGDLDEILAKESNQLKEQEARYIDLQGAIGAKLLPSKIALLNIVNSLIEFYVKYIETIREGAKVILEYAVQPIIGLIAIFNELKSVLNGTGIDLKRFINNFNEMKESFREFLDSREVTEESLGLGDVEGAIQDTATGVAGGASELEDAMKELYIKLRESIIDGNEDIAKEFRKLADKLQEIEDKLAQKLLELANKLAFDRAKVIRDYNNKVEDINRKARDKEYDAEKKYQDRLASLRAKFLMDLEEAVQERDARQIIRLIKRYNLQKDELARQRDRERRDIREDQERQLRDLERQRDLRLQELDIEYAFRRQKILDQAAFEAAQAEIDAEQRVREIQIATQLRNEELIRRYADEHEITQQFAEGIKNLLNSYFGPDGQIEGIYNYFMEMTQAVFESLAGSMQGINQLSKFLSMNPEVKYTLPGSPGGFAEGGTLVARKPTVALFGEAGPERVDFTPLTRPGSNVGKTFGGNLPGQTLGQGKIGIMISLSPGLEAEIINNTLGQMADVLFDTNRQKL